MRVARRYLGALALMCLTACSFARDVGRTAVEHNKALATTQSELLLLNIVRASYRQPMFFTGVTSLTQSVTASGKLTLGLPWDGRSDSGGAAPEGGVSTGPTATIAVLDGKEFMSGITSPLKASTFVYLWRQGWPKDILMNLFIKRIVVSKRDTTAPKDKEKWDEVWRAENYPPSPKAHFEFLATVKTLLDLSWSPELGVDDVEVGPPLVAADIKLLSVRVKIAEAGLTLKALDNGMVQLMKTKAQSKYRARGVWADPTWTSAGALNAYANVGTSIVPGFSYEDFRSRSALGAGTALVADYSYNIDFRSPEAVLYYLGELLREQRNRHGALVWVKAPREPRRGAKRKAGYDGLVPLFAEIPGASCAGCDPINVDHCGKTVSISGDASTSRSLHVISLMSQLFALHKSADELPKGGTVTLVGR